MAKTFSNNGRYINRELSWIEFNKRVLNISEDIETPLFERLKFIAITSSNFDEFFMVRVGSLNDQINAGFLEEDPSGMNPREQIRNIFTYSNKIVERQYSSFETIKRELLSKGIEFAEISQLEKEEKRYIDDYYEENIYPVLTPILVDKRVHSPLVMNKSLNIATLLEGAKGKVYLGTVQVPAVLGRYIEVPSKSRRKFVMLEDLIREKLDTLFSGHKIMAASCYRITRNADLTLDEEGAEDLLETIEESIKLRRWGTVVKLEVKKGIDERLFDCLSDMFEITEECTTEIDGCIDLTFLMKFSQLEGYEKLRYKDMQSQACKVLSQGEDIFETISKGDILLHHPYESFNPVVEMVESAAQDPKVLAIKQVLYRVSGNSPIIRALMKAAESGKQVTVLVELKARFDEENNINWARRLEKAGCHVIYGVVGLKTHCKILLIVRMDEDGVKRYVHLGTGNYNDETAKLYTDVGYFTAKKEYGADATKLFNMLSGHSKLEDMKKLYSAPINLRSRFEELIDREVQHAQNGKSAKIICKLNSLVDNKMIDKLYEASKAGVEIELMIRGVCCLVPGIKGISENISVRSIVGRFLEHSRIYYFSNGGSEELYISSADWMTRNLDRRVELLVSVEDSYSKEKLKDILYAGLRDNVNTKIMAPNGRYSRVKREGDTFDSHLYFYEKAIKDNKIPKKIFKTNYSGIIKQ